MAVAGARMDVDGDACSGWGCHNPAAAVAAAEDDYVSVRLLANSIHLVPEGTGEKKET